VQRVAMTSVPLPQQLGLQKKIKNSRKIQLKEGSKINYFARRKIMGRRLHLLS